MPFNIKATDLEIQLPVRGVDRGTVRAKQPPGTVPDCRNIRALDIRGRVGCGKRSGLAQAFDKAGSAGARRVTALARLTEAVSTTTSTGSYVDVAEAWSGITVATPTDLGDNWYTGEQISSGCTLSDTQFGVAAGPFLQFTGGAAEKVNVFACSYKTTNDVTMVASALPQATYGAGGVGASSECHCYGPFIRGDGRCKTIYAFRFRRVGGTGAGTAGGTNHIVVGELISAVGTVITVLASSSNYTLTGGVGVLPMTVHLYESSTGITADVSWPAAATGPADITFSLSYAFTNGTDLDGLPYASGGVAFCAANANGWSAVTRRVDSVSLTKIVPQATEVAAQYLGSAAPSPPPQAFFITDGWTTYVRNVTASSTVTTSAGYTESGTTSNQWISRDSDFLVPTQDTATLKHAGVYRTSDATRYGVEFRMRDDVASNDLRDSMCFFLRFAPSTSGSSTINENLQIHVPASGSASRATTELVGCSGLVVSYQNGGASGSAGGTELSRTSVGEGFVFRASHWVRCVDSGSIVLVTINGRPIYLLSSSTYGSNTRNGAGALYSGAATNPGGYGFRLFAIEDSVTRVGDVRSKILICNQNSCDIGTLNNLGLTRCSGGGFANALPSLFSFNLKWYGVDGNRNRIIDPALSTVSDWSTAVTHGTLPTGAHLAALYRGRAVLARTDSNPSMWFMSRVFDPLDWDFGALPLSTSAYAGTNADVGVPGDAITALIPFSDDYLIFGCATSIWMLEGDPGYGGAVQNLSYKTGIISNRAWCFDEKGNLFFMGLGGLYTLQRGSREPQNISGRRLANYLDEFDSDTILIQMAYDAFKKYVHIFLTNTDSAEDSIHVVYDLSNDAFFFDSYPGRSDPWSVCEITGTAFEDRRILLGGDDGFVRRFRDDITYDFDTTSADESASTIQTAVDSWIRFSPIDASSRVELLCTALQSQGSADNGAVTWEILRGDTVEDVSIQDLGSGVVSGTIFGNSQGQQPPVRVRVRGGAQQLILRQTSTSLTFKLEKIVMHYSQVGQRRS